ncbi:MAG TPA: hypothetical protein VHM19_04625 [Polyangiales bacterium]|jgi:hypothetical protein|nr:hypothetical protein [Polyangiales bacterium]
MTLSQLTQAFSKLKPIRLRVPGLLDVVVISDPNQMQWLNQREEVVRPLNPNASWLHRLLDQRLRVDLGFDGGMLPVFRPRSDAERAAQQHALEQRLEALRGAPGPERDALADYVSGEHEANEIGITVQQWCGRLFNAHYKAVKESYEAGKLLAGWPSAPPWRTWKQRANGCLAQAKRDVSNLAEGDLHCIHGTTIGMENVTRSVKKLREAAKDPNKQLLSPDDILRECLVAPPAVLRGVTRQVEVPFLNKPLTTQSLVVFLVARAYAASGELDVAFLADSWSACPAREVIPEMLRTVWHRALHEEDEASGNDGEVISEKTEKRLFETINTIQGISRMWHRAVS